MVIVILAVMMVARYLFRDIYSFGSNCTGNEYKLQLNQSLAMGENGLKNGERGMGAKGWNGMEGTAFE